MVNQKSVHFPLAVHVCRCTAGCLLCCGLTLAVQRGERKPKTQITAVKFSSSGSPEACDQCWDGEEEISGMGEDGEGWAPSEGVKRLV